MRIAGLCLLACALALPAFAATVIESDSREVALVELYTSEGCSSCPPADEALSRLTEADGLWRSFVPVAFHVTYWNHLGWADRFAKAAFDRRQKAWAGEWGHGVVYTPGVVIDGAEWRSRDIAAGLARRETGDTAGALRAEVAGDRVRLRYRGDAVGGPLQAHVVVLGFGLTTEVDAGENAHRTLRHDFVALDHRTVELESAEAAAGVAELTVDLAHPEADRLALAVWVSRRDGIGAIQAAGGWLAQ